MSTKDRKRYFNLATIANATKQNSNVATFSSYRLKRRPDDLALHSWDPAAFDCLSCVLLGFFCAVKALVLDIAFSKVPNSLEAWTGMVSQSCRHHKLLQFYLQLAGPSVLRLSPTDCLNAICNVEMLPLPKMECPLSETASTREAHFDTAIVSGELKMVSHFCDASQGFFSLSDTCLFRQPGRFDGWA